jgi:hypothetical protein
VKSILDPTFRYVSSVDTDLRKTFARIRREQREIAQAKAEQEAREANKVAPINQRKKA